MRIGSETNSLINHILSRMESEAPYVGMPATILLWTDRSPATVVEVTKKYIVVQEDDATRIDNNGMSESQEYVYTPNPDAHRVIYRKNKFGQWVRCARNPETGRLIQAQGASLLLGTREKYHDFSF